MGGTLAFEIRGWNHHAQGLTNTVATVQLFNAVGQLQHAQKIGLTAQDITANLPTEHLTAGIYFLQLEIAGLKKAIKFVIQ